MWVQAADGETMIRVIHIVSMVIEPDRNGGNCSLMASLSDGTRHEMHHGKRNECEDALVEIGALV